MRTNDLVLDTLGRVHELVPAVLDGLSADALRWRPDPGANPMGWLTWHFLRVEDDHLAGLGGVDQVWAGGWAERFHLPYLAHAHGYGMSAEEVGQFAVDGPELLVGYAAAVWEQTQRIVAGLTDDDYDRIVDTRWNPPVTLSVRMVSVMNEIAQHVGQVAYVKGLYERAHEADSGWTGHV